MTRFSFSIERFPDKFERQEQGIYNKMLDEFVSLHPQENDDPLMKASRLTQEDWCIMEWDDKEQGYCLTAGISFVVVLYCCLIFLIKSLTKRTFHFANEFRS